MNKSWKAIWDIELLLNGEDFMLDYQNFYNQAKKDLLYSC